MVGDVVDREEEEEETEGTVPKIELVVDEKWHQIGVKAGRRFLHAMIC